MHTFIILHVEQLVLRDDGAEAHLVGDVLDDLSHTLGVVHSHSPGGCSGS